jgi:hypothetical protein
VGRFVGATGKVVPIRARRALSDELAQKFEGEADRRRVTIPHFGHERLYAVDV